MKKPARPGAQGGSVRPREATAPSDRDVATQVPEAPVEEPAEIDDSKLPDAIDDGAAEAPEPDPGEDAPDAEVDGGEGEEDGKEDDEDEECGWWWPSPPDSPIPSSGTGGGYDGMAPAAGRSGIGPGLGVPSAAIPETPEIPAILVPPQPPAVPVLPALPAPVFAPAPVTGLGAGTSGVAAAPRAPAAVRTPAITRGTPPAEKPTAPPAADAVPTSFRAGYGEHLRTATMSEVAAIAVPGATGIMLLTGAGGLIGYRQTRAGLAVRSGMSGRFVS